jgi:dTDP-4-dehydrorhamnose reductase
MLRLASGLGPGNRISAVLRVKAAQITFCDTEPLTMRVTIFGATGMLGKALMRQWTNAGDEMTGLGSAEADIRNPDQVKEALQETRPDWIVLCAAYTDVDGCELNPQLATSVNTYGAMNVAKAAADSRAKLLFISTDYVFGGRKSSPYETDDPRNPINVYGASKAKAEEELSKILPGCSIVRTSWLFGSGGKCFPDTILRVAAGRPEIEVVNDQRGCPTYTLDLAGAIIRLCRAQASGIVHCTNSGECTWYDFAVEIVRQSELKTVVRPTTSNKYVRAAQRPAYSVLSPASLARYGIQMQAWQQSLADYLADRSAGHANAVSSATEP